MTDRPNPLRIVDRSPWNDPRAYRPDPVEMLRERLNEQHRPSYFADVAADWRQFWSDVADAPAHHALFGMLIVLAWTVLVAGPLWLGLVS